MYETKLLKLILIFNKEKSDWKPPEINLLLKLYNDNKELFGTNDKQFWNNLVSGMSEKNVYKTIPQKK